MAADTTYKSSAEDAASAVEANPATMPLPRFSREDPTTATRSGACRLPAAGQRSGNWRQVCGV